MSDASPNSIVSASELVVRYGVQAVLDQATLTIHQGERVGLVGRNGSGKSTFLQIAAGILQPDAGDFVRRRDLVTGYMAQALTLDESATESTRKFSFSVAANAAEYFMRRYSSAEAMFSCFSALQPLGGIGTNPSRTIREAREEFFEQTGPSPDAESLAEKRKTQLQPGQ